MAVFYQVNCSTSIVGGFSFDVVSGPDVSISLPFSMRSSQVLILDGAWT